LYFEFATNPGVQLPTSADNVALPALAAVHRAAARLLLLLTAGPPAAQQSIDISWLAAVPTAANPQHWRAAARWDRRTDGPDRCIVCGQCQ